MVIEAEAARIKERAQQMGEVNAKVSAERIRDAEMEVEKTR